MKLRRIPTIASFLVLIPFSASAHGGVYNPPPPEPTKPTPGVRPSGPGAAGSGPRAPAAPMAPITPGPALTGPTTGAGVAGLGGTPTTFASGALDVDPSLWSAWWDLNKAPYLDLDRHVHALGALTGDTSWFLGQHAAFVDLRPTEQQVRDQIVPALLEVLGKETNNDLVSGTLVALAKIGPADSAEDARRFEAAIARYLVDANQEIRETAAVSLGILANSRSIPLLANLLWDTEAGRALVKRDEVDYRTRAFAAYGLGLVGARAESAADRQIIVAALSRAFERDATPTPDVGVACLLALSIVPIAEAGPERALDEHARAAPESSRRAQLAYVLGALHAERLRPQVRAQAPVALARLLEGLPAECAEALRARVAGELVDVVARGRELPEVLQGCLLALGRIGTSGGAAVDVQIRAALRDAFDGASENQSRGFALIALAQVGARAGAGTPGAGLEDAGAFLVGQLDGKTMVRAWAGLACGILGHELARANAASPVLERLRRGVRTVLADERDPEKLGAYAIAAGLLRDAESAPLLAGRLAKALPDDARGRVATGLALLGYGEARPVLRQVLSEATYRPVLLRECAVALGILEDKQAAPLLLHMLAESNSMAAQTAISTALGLIGDQRTVEPLLAALHDIGRSERSRGYASVALGNVADKEDLPWNAKIAGGLNYRAATSTLTDPQRGGGILDIF